MLAFSLLHTNGAFKTMQIFLFDLNFHPEDLHPIDATTFFKIRTGIATVGYSTVELNGDVINASFYDGVLKYLVEKLTN